MEYWVIEDTLGQKKHTPLSSQDDRGGVKHALVFSSSELAEEFRRLLCDKHGQPEASLVITSGGVERVKQYLRHHDFETCVVDKDFYSHRDQDIRSVNDL